MNGGEDGCGLTLTRYGPCGLCFSLSAYAVIGTFQIFNHENPEASLKESALHRFDIFGPDETQRRRLRRQRVSVDGNASHENRFKR